MEETAMSKKILGKKEEETKKEEEKVDYLAENYLWNVTKEGCGTSVLAGTIVASMMSVEERKMARAGKKKFSNETFTFERK